MFFTGQITGVEGYVESAMTGIYVGMNISRMFSGKEMISFPVDTMCGALINYITTANELKPMYANFGLLGGTKDREKIARHSLDMMNRFLEEVKRK